MAGIGDTNPVRPVVELYALLCVKLSLDELALEVEDDRSTSACFVSLTSELSLYSLFGVRDIPGNPTRWMFGMALASSASLTSTCVFRYAAEPCPRSEVCRNHVGSFAASDCAISLRSIGAGSSNGGSEVSFGERVAVSPPIMENGRVLNRTGDCEFGLRCHERVGLLDGIALDGEALTEMVWTTFFSGTSLLRLIGDGALSFVGESSPVRRPIVSPSSCSRFDN